jgi:hypothetical protein
MAGLLLQCGGMIHATLTSRLLEPLTHPMSVVTGGALAAGLFPDDRAVFLSQVAWRVLRLLLSL